MLTPSKLALGVRVIWMTGAPPTMAGEDRRPREKTATTLMWRATTTDPARALAAGAKVGELALRGDTPASNKMASRTQMRVSCN